MGNDITLYDSINKSMFSHCQILNQSMLLTNDLILEVFPHACLKSAFRKFFGPYNDFICTYDILLGWMLPEVFHTNCYMWAVLYTHTFITDYSVQHIKIWVRSKEDEYSSLVYLEVRICPTLLCTLYGIDEIRLCLLLYFDICNNKSCAWLKEW